MCYYNGQKVTRAEFIQLKQLEKAVRDYDFLDVGVHNGFNYAPCAIIVPTDDTRDFEIQQAEWGYVPGYLKTREEATKFRRMYTTLNFKGENLFTKDDGKKSMWADAARKRRCLVLSTGIIESRHEPTYGKQGQVLKATAKIPYYINVVGKEYFWFVGLYNDWFDPEKNAWVRTVAFATTAANGTMKYIHNSKERMPTIPPDDLCWEWLMEEPSDERLQEIAVSQIPSSMMEACTISSDYRFSGEATPQEYADHPALDSTFVDTEELAFDHWRG